MSQSLDLKAIERKVRKTTQGDGVIRLLVGIWFALFALFSFDHRHTWAPGLGTVLLIWLPDLVREKITYPRVGYVKFAPEKTTTKVVKTLAFIIAFSFAGVMDHSPLDWLGPVYLGTFATVVVLLWTRQFGSFLDYIFAGLCLASGFVGLWYTSQGVDSDIVCALQFWSLAGILIPIGLFQFILFLRNNPLVSEEASYGNN